MAGGLKKVGSFLIVPGVMGVTFLAIRKEQKINVGQKIAIVGSVGLLTWLVKRTVKSYSGGSNIKDAPVDYGQIPILPSGLRWDPDPLAKEIFDNIEGPNFWDYATTADKVTNLNNDQLRLLYNHYNSYYATDYPTLTQLWVHEWAQRPSAFRSYPRVRARLKGQGLY